MTKVGEPETPVRRLLRWSLLTLPPIRRLHTERSRAILELAHERFNSGLRYLNDCGTSADQARVLALFRLFSPLAVSVSMTRIGHRRDGGYVMADSFASVHAAFSFGIADETSWDEAIARRGIQVYQYDGTIDRPPVKDPHFTFHKKMIGPQQNASTESLASVLAAHGAPGNGNILKLDIEGTEWEIFDAASSDDLQRFSQIVCEFHGFQHIDDPTWHSRALRGMIKLRSLFEVVHVHANNGGHLAIFANVPFPMVLEVTFLSKSGYSFGRIDKTFPTPLDAPNDPYFADIFLGSFQF
jgi:hypothetical protein